MRNRKNLGTMVVLNSWKRICSIFIAITLLMGALGIALLWTKNPKHFPIRVIEISEALRYVSEETLITAVTPHLAKGFFWLEVKAVQESVAKLPWVIASSVKRLWPDKVQLCLQEHIPQARFENNGVIDTEGRVFYPERSTISDKWPLFKGPIEKTHEMLQQYLTVLESLGPLGLTVAELHLTDYGAWNIMLDNGLAIILGKTELADRLTRFVLAYRLNLKAELEKIAYIDCRYTNGLAIGYKAGYGPG